MLVDFQMLIYALMWLAAWRIVPGERRAAGWWMGFSLCLWAGLYAMGLRPQGPLWLTSTFANSSACIGFIMMWRGVGAFLGLRQRNAEHAGLIVLIVGGLALADDVSSAAGLYQRGVLIPVALAWIFLRISAEILRPLRLEFSARVAWLAVVPLTVYGLLNLQPEPAGVLATLLPAAG
ncbi:MAG: hypothetical protein RJA44_2171 [Pseudomonadota bacterium]|jgi:hypothetical protein